MRTKTYYRVCPYCGSNLDPGEHCDCGENRKGSERNVIIRPGNDRLHNDPKDKPPGWIRRNRYSMDARKKVTT